MKTFPGLLLVALILLAPGALLAAPPSRAEAIRLVRAEVTRHERWEYDARYAATSFRGGWYVTARRVYYPYNDDADRSVAAGGFRAFVVNPKGRVSSASTETSDKR